LFYNATLIECMYSGHRVRLNTEYRGFQSCWGCTFLVFLHRNAVA
jgi:hypothetical protein